MEKEIVCVKIQERFQFSLSDAAKEVEKVLEIIEEAEKEASLKIHNKIP